MNYKVFNSKGEYEAYYNGAYVKSGDLVYVRDETADEAHFFTNNIDGTPKQYDGTISKE